MDIYTAYKSLLKRLTPKNGMAIAGISFDKYDVTGTCNSRIGRFVQDIIQLINLWIIKLVIPNFKNKLYDKGTDQEFVENKYK